MVEQLADKITWLRHASFRIDTEKVIYIDPFKLSGGPKADIILITHKHYDHCSPVDIAKIQKNETVIITEKSSAEQLAGDVRVIKAGETIDVDGVRVTAVPSYNLNKKFHPSKNQWIGYVIDVGGVKIYHAGDSDYIPEMKDIEADIALLPVSGTYVMTAEEAPAEEKDEDDDNDQDNNPPPVFTIVSSVTVAFTFTARVMAIGFVARSFVESVNIVVATVSMVVSIVAVRLLGVGAL